MTCIRNVTGVYGECVMEEERAICDNGAFKTPQKFEVGTTTQ